MLTKNEVRRLERIQRTALHVIMGDSYTNYKETLTILGLESLEDRRNSLMVRFVIKTLQTNKFQHWFVRNTEGSVNTRNIRKKWKEPICRTDRLWKSPIPFYCRMLNSLDTDWGEVISKTNYKCDQCDTNFSCGNNLEVHRRIKHQIDGTDPQWSVHVK